VRSELVTVVDPPYRAARNRIGDDGRARPAKPGWPSRTARAYAYQPITCLA
jgi:hypothetical protein